MNKDEAIKILERAIDTEKIASITQSGDGKEGEKIEALNLAVSYLQNPLKAFCNQEVNEMLAYAEKKTSEKFSDEQEKKLREVFYDGVEEGINDVLRDAMTAAVNAV